MLGCCLQRELGQLVLKRFLLLVLLLDKAATHLTAAFRTPLLFKLTASVKSSRQVRTSSWYRLQAQTVWKPLCNRQHACSLGPCRSMQHLCTFLSCTGVFVTVRLRVWCCCPVLSGGIGVPAVTAGW